jgi:hypothetical protein
LAGDIVSVAVSTWCVCGVHVANLVRRAGAAGMTSSSAAEELPLRRCEKSQQAGPRDGPASV